MDHAIIRPSQSLVKGGGPAAQFRLSDGASVQYFFRFWIQDFRLAADTGAIRVTWKYATRLRAYLPNRCCASFSFSMQTASMTSSFGSSVYVRLMIQGFFNAPGSS